MVGSMTAVNGEHTRKRRSEGGVERTMNDESNRPKRKMLTMNGQTKTKTRGARGVALAEGRRSLPPEKSALIKQSNS